MIIRNADYWIKNLDLIPHPEGGYYREIYSSSWNIQQSALPSNFKASRNFYTSIYFLLKSDQVSHFHRIKSDEIWTFHVGDPMDIHVIDESANYSILHLGLDTEKFEMPQQMVKAGLWFGAKLSNSSAYALVSCIVAPGFNFEDFELAKREDLLQTFPKHDKIINELTSD